MRRGGALLVLAGAAYGAVEVVSYEQTYPEAADRAELVQLADNPAVRVLQGAPRAVETTGGFVVWDAGWFLALVVSIWALLATTRLLRAEEDQGRAEIVLSAPVHPVRLLVAQLGVLAAVVSAFGAGVAVVLVLLGLPGPGSLLFGAALAGVGATAVGLAAVAAQLLDVRRRAVAAAAGAVGLLFALRMVGSSADGRSGALWMTPFGWLDRVEPYAANRWPALLPLLVVPALLGWAAVVLRGRRDTGAGLLRGRDRRAPRTGLLTGPVAFGWRATQGVLLAWGVGMALFGVTIGALVSSVADLASQDGAYRQALEDLGIDVDAPVDGFLAVMALTLALLFALFAAWRIGALRSEEAAGRLEHLLVRPVSRPRWLLGSTALSLVAVVLVVVLTGLGIAVGAAGAGLDLDPADALRPVLATLPVVVLFAGLGVLAFGLAPRLTVALPVALAVLAFVLDLVLTLLDLPDGLRRLSPFAWLPRPPDEPFSLAAAAVLCLLGALAVAAGTVAFTRRDLSGD